MVVYTVYADDKLIHHSESSAPEVKLINPKLSMEENSSGSFSCTIPPSNVGYDFVTRITTEIRIKRQTIDSQTGYLGAEKEIWSGRVIDEKTDFFNNRQITCEGALSYLNDTIQPQAKYENYTPENMLRKLIDNHNTKAVPYVKPGSSYSYNHRFYVGAVTVHDPDTQVGFTTYETNFESTMDDVNSKLLNTCGGHLVLRRNASDGYNYIDYLEEYSKLNNQKIEFGKNLLDFSKSFDVSSICTVLIPLGERLEGEVDDDMDSYLTVESVNSGSIYVVNTEAVNTFGWIEKTVHFDDIEDPSILLRRARRYLEDTQFEQLTLELTAVDMHYLGIDDGELFELYDMVHCTSKPHGLDRTFPIKKVEIPIDNPQNTTFTIGDNTVANTLSSSLTNSNATINAKIDALPSTTSVLKEAKRNADQLMRQLSNGYISTIIEGTDENAHSEAQVISNAQNLYEDATKFWIWNINGLAHYSGTWNDYKRGIGQLDTAITMDGTIVANRILTGTLGKPEWGNYWNMETGEFILSPGRVKTGGSNYYKNVVVRFDSQSSSEQAIYDWVDVVWKNDSGTYSYVRRGGSTWDDVYIPAVYGELYIYWRSDGSGHSYNGFRVNSITSYTTGSATTPTGTRTTIIPSSDTLKDSYSVTSSNAYSSIKSPTNFPGEYTDTERKLWTVTINNITPTEATLANYTEGKVDELDDSLNQESVFNRLTNNGTVQGITMSGGQLYINATYINTGTMSANRVRTGKITSANNSMEIDLDNNKITSKKLIVSATNFTLTEQGNMTANNAKLTGDISFKTTNDFVNATFSGYGINLRLYSTDIAGVWANGEASGTYVRWGELSLWGRDGIDLQTNNGESIKCSSPLLLNSSLKVGSNYYGQSGYYYVKNSNDETANFHFENGILVEVSGF